MLISILIVFKRILHVPLENVCSSGNCRKNTYCFI
nr:MAG TPA: hypothetical protein [Caudoviricetes sp.]